jgi:serine/threonine-protein kinase
MAAILNVTTHDQLYGRMLGDFVLRECLGEGGFGAVYRCEQLPLGREAVIKVLHQRASDGDASYLHFAREARLASKLDHPYAAHVYAFGVESDDGLIWIAMELVRGVSLRQYLDERGSMPLEQFVPFFERVCEVIQAAHESGIVHRDLKPDNIMVIEHAEKMSPKLVDFGIAKLLEEAPPPSLRLVRDGDVTAPLPCDSDLTPCGTIFGSPLYVAPELWRGCSATPAADIYALGVIAFEALTGRRPFRGDSAINVGEQHCSTDVPTVGGGLPKGLDRIFAKALAKTPADRYSSAIDLAAALRAEADAQLVAQIRAAARAWDDRGRPEALLWRGEVLGELERWILRTTSNPGRRELEFVEASREASEREEDAASRRRRRVRRLGAAAALWAAMIVVGGFQAFAWHRTLDAERQTADARALVRATTLTAEVEQGRAALLGGDLSAAREHLGTAWAMGPRDSATAFMFARSLQPVRAERARLVGTGRMWSASWSPDSRWIVTTDDRDAQIWDGTSYRKLATLPHRDTVYAAVWSGSDRLITACGDGSVRIWNAGTGSMVRELRLGGKASRWYVVAVSGSTVAAVDAKGAVAAVWDMEIGATLTELTLDATGWPSVGFSADGRWLAVSGGGSVHVVDAKRWRPVLALSDRVRAIAWDPTGPRLLTGGEAGEASIWDIPTGDRRAPYQLGEVVTAVAFSPHGHRAAIAGAGGTEQIADTTTQRILSRTNRLHAEVVSIAFDADGQRAVTAGASGEVAIGDSQVLDGPTQQLRGAWFDPSGSRVLAASWDGTARVWNAETPYRRWGSPAAGTGYGLFGGVEPDGRYMAVAAPGGPTRVWDTARDRLLAELPEVGPGELVPFPVVSPDGTRAAVARNSMAEVYELPGGRLIMAIGHGAVVTALTFAGDELISGSADGAVLKSSRSQTVTLQPASDAGIDALAVFPDGRIATADTSGRVRVFGLNVTAIAFDAAARVRMLRPSADGRRLLAVPFHAGKPAPMVLLDLDRSVVIRLEGSPVYAARWTSVGILSAHADAAARLWTSDGVLRQIYHGGSRFMSDADLSPDGSMVVAGGGDGLIRFWDVITGHPLWNLPAHKPYIMGLHFQSGSIVTRGIGGEMARWHLPDSLRFIVGQ